MPAVQSEPKTTPARVASPADSAPGIDHWLRPGAETRVANVLTIDLEDWPIAVLGPHHEISDRVLDNTRHCLRILKWHHVKATFFVLTKVAERFPDLIREVYAAGHEIASHGHGHERLTDISPRRFELDVRRSIHVLTDIVGERPIGYRAPAFSIVESTLWAGPILAELGFKYDSSIFPIHHPRYGIARRPRHIHRWQDCRLIECPLATVSVLGLNLPIAGGGYFRLLPGPVVRRAVNMLNRRAMPAILYLHPHELDAPGIRAHKREGVRVPAVRHVLQSLFRHRIEHRLHRLLGRFPFTTMRDLLRNAE